MTPLRVLVAHAQASLSARVIADALRFTDGVQVVEPSPVSLPEVESCLDAASAQIDVLVITGPTSGATIDVLHAKYPALILSHVDTAPSMINIRLRDVGLDGLLMVFRGLARAPLAGTAPRRLAFRLLDQQAMQPKPPDEARIERFPAHVIRWLDASLLRYCHTSPCSPMIGGSALCRSTEALAAMLAPGKLDTSDADAEEEAQLDRLFGSSDDKNLDPLIFALHHRLKLTRLETGAVLLALAPELDHRYQLIYGCLQDDMMRRVPSLGLICAILGDPVRVRLELTQTGGLRRWQLFAAARAGPSADEPLQLDTDVIAFLLGEHHALPADSLQTRIVRQSSWPGAEWIGDSAHSQDSAVLASRILLAPSRWVAITGGDTDGARAMLEWVVRRLGLVPLRISLARLAVLEPARMSAMCVALARAVRLEGRLAVVDATDVTGTDIERQVLAHLSEALDNHASPDTPDLSEMPGVIIAAQIERFASVLRLAERTVIVRAPVTPRDAAVRLHHCARESGVDLSLENASRLTRAQPLRLATMQDALLLARASGITHLPPHEQLGLLTDSLHKISVPQLSQFARRITPAQGLDRVVLPTDRRAQLDEIVSHVRYAPKVLDEWGFEAGRPLSRGIAALFCGASGTGKSMAAEAVAHALNVDAYLVDLAQIVSKYIGESEKNLEVVFGEAEEAGAMLVFNEADVLFSKRGDVRDAHDRYANMEVAYLLQRIEQFSGLAVLTTNFRQNIDPAFLRRLRFIVDFPRPDAAAREAIWRQCLPEDAPKAEELHLNLLARRLELTGGSISQITLRAAFAAARNQSKAIGFDHLIEATRAELLKIGMTSAERDLAALTAAMTSHSARAA
jgi:hypothetical protein